jgi:hypothetical protein
VWHCPYLWTLLPYLGTPISCPKRHYHIMMDMYTCPSGLLPYPMIHVPCPERHIPCPQILLPCPGTFTMSRETLYHIMGTCIISLRTCSVSMDTFTMPLGTFTMFMETFSMFWEYCHWLVLILLTCKLKIAILTEIHLPWLLICLKCMRVFYYVCGKFDHVFIIMYLSEIILL